VTRGTKQAQGYIAFYWKMQEWMVGMEWRSMPQSGSGAGPVGKMPLRWKEEEM